MTRVRIPFSDTIKRRVRQMSLLSLVLLIVVLVLVALQVERFITQGTVLGYQVRHVRSSNIRGATEAETKRSATSMSQACKKLSEEFVGNQLKQPVQQNTFLPDRTTPELFSSCVFRTKENPTRTVSVSLRERPTEDAARSAVTVPTKNSSKVSVDGADEAYFGDTTNQLVARKKATIITVTVTKPSEKKPASKDVATALARELLK